MDEKIYLNGVSQELGLNLMPGEQTINKILYLAKYEDLPLYFDNEIIGAKVSDGVEEINDNFGRHVAWSFNGESTELGVVRKRLVPPEVSDGLEIAISQFIYDDEKYYSADLSGEIFHRKKLHYKYFYCLREELDTFKNSVKAIGTKDQKHNPDSDLTWEGFIPKAPTKRKHTLRNIVIDLVTEHIKGNDEYPTGQTLWDLLIEKCSSYGYDYDEESKCIPDLSQSSKGLNQKGFRRLLSSWGAKL